MRAVQNPDALTQRLSDEVIAVLPDSTAHVLDGNALAVFDACDGEQDVLAVTGLSVETCAAELRRLQEAGLVLVERDRQGVHRRTVLAGAVALAPLVAISLPALSAAASTGTTSSTTGNVTPNTGTGTGTGTMVPTLTVTLTDPSSSPNAIGTTYRGTLTIAGAGFTPGLVKLEYTTFSDLDHVSSGNSNLHGLGQTVSTATGAFSVTVHAQTNCYNPTFEVKGTDEAGLAASGSVAGRDAP